MHHLLFIICTCFLFTACKEDAKKGADCYDNYNNTQLINYQGTERAFVLYLPDGYDGSRKVPLLFNFHGFGGSTNDHLNTSDMRQLADRDTFILVYPQGSCLEGFSHWNAALPSATNKSTVDDLGFIDFLINDLSSTYEVDSARIYACGYSNGAFFSYALACYLGHKIAAIGSVSGTMLDSSLQCSPSHPTAMINLHGTNDGVVPYNGSSEYIAIPDVVDYWCQQNNTDLSASLSSENYLGTTIEKYLYANGDSAVSVEHYKIIGGGHDWFDIEFSGASTNEILWDFLSKYDLYGRRP